MNPVFHFELRYWLRSPLFYFISLALFLFTLIGMLGSGGYFDEPALTTNSFLLNTAYALAFNTFLLTKLMLFITAMVGGLSLYRDYTNNVQAVLYSYPISKSTYLNGKLFSALVALTLALIIAFSGFYAGSLLLGPDNPLIGLDEVLAYFTAFAMYALPSILIIGTLVLVVVGSTRNIYSGFILVICLVLFQTIMTNMLMEHEVLLILLDPFAQHAFHKITKTWDIQHQNSNALPISKLLFFNRLFWIAIALMSYLVFYKKFNFQIHPLLRPAHYLFKVKKTFQPTNIQAENKVISISNDDSLESLLKTWVWLSLKDFQHLLRHWMFLLLCGFGVLVVFFIQLKVTKTGNFNLQPLTRIVIGAPLGFYCVIVILSTFIFSGFLVHRARQSKMNLLVDINPIRNWQLAFSKIIALALLQIIQLLLFICTSCVIQISNNYYDFEFGLFFFQVFILVFPVMLIWNITAHFIHTLVPNLFLGLFVLAALWMGAQSLDQFGLDTKLLQYNTYPSLPYSDFQGYGNGLYGYFFLVSYWASFAGLSCVFILLSWRRGILNSMKEWWKLSKSKWTRALGLCLFIFSAAFFLLSGKIYSEEQRKPNYKDELNSSLSIYKSEWGKFSNLVLPKITDIELKIDLFPSFNSFNAKGSYTLVNKSTAAIDTLLVRTGFDEITQLDWSTTAVLIKINPAFKSNLVKLKKPLLPGDSMTLSFIIRNESNRIFTRNSNVLVDGTYLKQDLLPRLGYQFTSRELPLTDSLVHQHNYFHRDADVVHLRTIISTESNQIAIAPGKLISKKIVGNRSVFNYETMVPIKLNFSFHSADFKVRKELFNGKRIELYCKKGHEANTEFMLDAVKASLDYNTNLFGKYPHETIRIIEFPHTEEGFSATLCANNIPTSEIAFNINNDAMKDKMNLPFYIIAHELTHEWFGNQVMPADAEGAKMLTESITEYLSLNIYQKHFGESYAGIFLDAQKRRYLKGRTMETQEEQPLSKVLSQQEYISYGKGSLAFHAIANTIGTKKLLSILKEYLDKYRGNDDYYPCSTDFTELLIRDATEEQQDIILDWLTKVKTIDF